MQRYPNVGSDGLGLYPEPLLGVGVSSGRAGGLLQDAETSVRKVAIDRVIADPAYKAV